MTWEGLNYRIDLFAAEHARLKRIREQIESPGLDAAIAAGRCREDRRCAAGADLHAGARRSGRSGAARRRYRAAPQLRPGRSRRHAPRFRGVVAAARAGRRRIAVAPRRIDPRARHRARAPGAAPHRDNEMPVGADDQPQRSADLRAHGDGAQPARAPRSGSRSDRRRDRARPRAREGRRREPAGRPGARRPRRSCPPSVRQTLPWTITRTPDAVPALFGLRDLLWLGKPELPRETLDRWGVYSESLDSRLRTAMPRPRRGKTSAAAPTAG